MLVQHLRIIQFIQKRHTLGGCSQRKGFTSILQIACKPLLINKKPLSCGAYILLLAVYFVRHSQFFAALSATRSQYATTISRLHTLTETMLVVSFSVVVPFLSEIKTFHNLPPLKKAPYAGAVVLFSIIFCQ